MTDIGPTRIVFRRCMHAGGVLGEMEQVEINGENIIGKDLAGRRCRVATYPDAVNKLEKGQVVWAYGSLWGLAPLPFTRWYPGPTIHPPKGDDDARGSGQADQGVPADVPELPAQAIDAQT